MNFASGHNLMQLLVDALGLRGRPIQKVVIEIDIYNVAKVYIKELLTAECLEAVTDCIHVAQEAQREPLEVIVVDDVQVIDCDGVKVMTHIAKTEKGNN